jgi:ATP-binding cassette subfamily B protein
LRYFEEASATHRGESVLKQNKTPFSLGKTTYKVFKISMPRPSIKNNFKRVWRNLSKRRKVYFILLLGLMTVASFMEAISISAILPFIAVLSNPEKVFTHEAAQLFINILGIKTPEELLFPFTIVFGLLIFIGISLRLVLLWAQTRIGYGTSAAFSSSIYMRTLYQPYSVHVSRNSSEVISGITNKAAAILTYLITPLMNLISSSVTIMAIIITLFTINPFVALTAFFGFGVLYAGIILLVKKQLSANSIVLSQESIQMVKALQEGLGGIRDVLIDGTQGAYGKIFNKAQASYNESLANNQIVGQSPRLIVEFLGIMFICIIAYQLVLKGDGFMSAIPTLAALALGAQRLLPNLQNFYYNWTSIRAGQESVEDGLQFLEQPYPEHANKPNPAPILFTESIQLDKVSFQYTNEGAFVLKNLNLTLEKGKRYGFVGTTGCGKSTLLDVIMGLLKPTNGYLKIDNQIITEENHRSWQVIIAHVPQAIYLSDTSLAENIAFGVEVDKIDMKRVKEAAEKAQIAETIEALPQKYKTFVGERGIRLSGGQRQRIGIARALYKKAQVIVFDEATSALDNETELAVMEGIEQLADDLTILIVAHRVTTLKRCDKIFRMDKGEVIEEGAYEEMVVG